MSMFYSKSTGGFYDSTVHGEDIPSDAVPVSESAYDALFAAQAEGQTITADTNGNPIATDPPPPTVAQRNAPVKAQIALIDLLSVGAMRAWIVAQPTAPQALKDLETAAVAERAKLVTS